jgi:hydroxymethylpyrimidine pyrophosphatase-like HAD family hydrolase
MTNSSHSSHPQATDETAAGEEPRPGRPEAAAPSPLALLLDIDGTLTPPRQRLLPAMAAALRGLRVPFHVAAGSDLPLVGPQFLEPLWEAGFRGGFEAFVSNGAAHYRCDYAHELMITKQSEFDLRRHFGDEDFGRLLAAVEEVLDSPGFALTPPLAVIGERLVNRGGMLNVTPIGRPAGELSEEARRNREIFAGFDRASRYRRRMLEVFQERLAWAVEDRALRMMLGGETSFDFVVGEMDKTNAVRSLLAMGVERVVFIGDALFAGGNDEVIADYIAAWPGQEPCPVEAVPVASWEETVQLFRDRGWL